MRKLNWKVFFLFSFLAIIFYLPVLLYPQLLMEKNNDLQEFFWPIFYYTKYHILLDKSLPLWNNLFLSGVPLLPDPQSFLFYPPNLLFLFLPMQTAFVTSFFIHTLFGVLGVYLCARYIFKISFIPSVFTASLYIFSPKVAGYLEAGHYGLVTSFTWLPFVLLSNIMLAKSPKIFWSAILALSLAGIFYTHSVTFILTAVITIPIFLVAISLNFHKQLFKKSLLLFTFAGIITFGLTAITLLPQMEWMPDTTRFLLLENKDVYPKWFSKKEFLTNIFLPWLNGPTTIWTIDSEKWLSLGILSSILALLGFFALRRKVQFLLSFLIFFTILIVLNNASPLYSILLSLDSYILMRITTRVWFILIFTVIFLAGFGLELLLKRKVRPLFIFIIITVTLGELLFLSWSRLLSPSPIMNKFAPIEVFQFFKQDKDQFRIFCLNRCLSQQTSALYNLELVEGYNTLMQKNYYKHMWQLSGGYWNYYTLSLPPIGTYGFQNLQPNAESLGAYNTKYVLSPHELTNKNFLFEKKFGNYLLYKNKLFLSRAYFKENGKTMDKEAPILTYQPNLIRVDTSQHLSSQLILAENYNKGWQAFLNGKEETPILETPNSLRLVNITPNTKFVEFRYSLKSFKIGKAITTLTIFVLITVFIYKAIYRKRAQKLTK